MTAPESTPEETVPQSDDQSDDQSGEQPGEQPGDQSTEAPGFRPPHHRGEATHAAALALARLAPGRLTAAFAAPLLPVVALGSVLFARLAPQRFAWTDGPIVFTAGPAVAPLTRTELTELAVFALALPLALGIGLTAALVVATASCLDVPVRVGPAVLRALNHRRATGAATLAAVLFLAAPVVAVAVAERFSVFPGLAAAAVLLWAALLLAHRTARLVAGLPRDPVIPRPRWEWWPIPTGQLIVYTLRPAAVLTASLTLGLLVGWGTSFLPGPPPLRWTAALFLVGAVCVAGGAWLAAILVTGAMEYRGVDGPSVFRNEQHEKRTARRRASVEALRAGLRESLAPAPADGRAQKSPVRSTAPVLGAAVAAVLVLPGALWVRADEPVAFSVEYVPIGEESWNGRTDLDMAAFDDGLRLSAPSVELWCDPRCTVALYSEDGIGATGGSHAWTPGGGARAHWERARTPRDSIANEVRTLILGTDCDARGCHAPEQELDVLEVFGHHGEKAESLADVAEHDGGFHVVTAASADGYEMTVDVRSCADECSEPVTLGRVPALLGDSHLPERLLDSATGPDGSLLVTLYDRATGSVRLFRCSDTACTETSTAEIVPPAVVGSVTYQPADWRDVLTGARVEVRPDGRPVVAYRAADGSARLVDCADADCADSEERVFTDLGWEQHLPGLALNPEGRPVLALADSGTDTLSLVVCADTGCAEWESRVLHDAVRVRSGAEVVVAPGGLPVVAAILDPSAVRIAGKGPNRVAALHRCAEPGCGLGS